MKSLKYLLVPALTGLLFAACNTAPQGPSQAELDAQVDAKVKAATDKLKTDCDARIMQAAQLKADTILASMAKTSATAKPAPAPHAPKAKLTATPPPPPPTIGNGKPKMGAASNEVGNGKPKMGGTKDEKGKVEETKVGNGKPKMGGNK